MKKINKTNSQIRTEKEKLVMENFNSVMKKLDATFLIESDDLLSEGILDKIGSKLKSPIEGIVNKLGDNGEKLYQSLVNKFGENPSFKDIQAKVNSLGESYLNEDRFDDKGIADNPKYTDKEGKENMADKVMNVVSQIAGINLVAFGGIPLGGTIGMLMSNSDLGSRPGFFIGALASLVISLLINSLGNKYGRHRATQ